MIRTGAECGTLLLSAASSTRRTLAMTACDLHLADVATQQRTITAGSPAGQDDLDGRVAIQPAGSVVVRRRGVTLVTACNPLDLAS